MKNNRLLFAFMISVFFATQLATAQMNYWTTPPYRFDMNPSTPTRTNISQSYFPYEVSNGAYDQTGNLLFYTVNDGLVDANGNYFGSLGGYNLDNCDEAYGRLQAEVAIVPVPGSCNRFYVIYGMDNPVGDCILLYIIADCSTTPPSVTYSKMTSVYCPPGDPYYAGEGFIITNAGGIDHASFAVSKVISGVGSGSQRYLYATSLQGIYKYTITSSGIGSGYLTATLSDLNLNFNNFEGLEAELSWNQDIFAWIDRLGGKVHTIRLNALGDFIAGSLVSYSLGGAKGIEFTNALSNPFLYVTYPFGVRKINTETQTTTLLKNVAGVNLANSFLEYGKNGKIYGVSPTYDIQGNLVSTTLVGISSTDTYSYVNAGFDSRFYDISGNGIFTLPDQIDGDNYNYFFGNPYVTVSNFTLNGISPSTSCVSATNFYNCAPIIFNATYSGGSTPSQYKFEIKATDANCNIITGQNYINYNSGWTSGQPSMNLDLRDFKDNNNLSLGNITGKVNVKYSIQDACGNESSKNYTIILSSAPQASIVLEIYNKSNPQNYLSPSHSISSPVNVGTASLGFRINNSTGLINYYKVVVDEVSSSGSFIKNIVIQTFTTNGTGGLTYENLNNYCARESSWPSNPGFGNCNYTNPGYNGFSGYFSYSNGLYSWQRYMKLTVTVGNICGESSDFSYLYVETRNNKSLLVDGNNEVNLKNLEANECVVYPNPAENHLNFMLKLNEEQRISIELTDISGRTIQTLLSNELMPPGESTRTINLNDLPSGMYIYRIISDRFTKGGIITKN